MTTQDDLPDAKADLAALLEAVQSMRNSQREYFRTRTGAALGKSRTAERRVDQLLAEITGRTPQKRLF